MAAGLDIAGQFSGQRRAAAIDWALITMQPRRSMTSQTPSERDPIMAEDGKIHIPADGIPSLRIVAGELSGRLGRSLNFAHAYYAILSAEQAGAIPQGQWSESPQDPAMLDKLTMLLQQHPELLEELLNHDKLNKAEELADKKLK
jgi:hypothetical protein